MATTLRSGQNTYPSTVTGGSQVANNMRFDIEPWAEALEPRKTPMLTRLYDKNPVNRRPHYWGQSYLTPVESLVASSFSSTTLAVTTGEGVFFQKYMVLRVTDFISGSTTLLDESTAEDVWVSGEPSTDNLTVVRAQGGTSQVTHPVGAHVRIIGVAAPELQSHTIAPVTRGVRAYNYVQRFQGGVKADKAAQVALTFEHGENENPLMTDFINEQQKQKFLVEESIWYGGRQAGDVATPLPAMFGGIDTFLTTNVTDLAGVPLTPRLVEAELRDLAKNTDGGPEGIELFMGYDAAAVMDTILDPIRMATATDTTVSLYTERVKYRFGTFTINTSQNCPPGRIYGLRPDLMKVRPFKGLAWHTSKVAGELNGRDYDEIYTSADMTFQLMQEHSMFVLKNFDVNLDTYGSIPVNTP